MTKDFPVYPSHAVASCAHCGGDFGDRAYWFRSDYPEGRGGYVQHCERCRMSTWYDIPSAVVPRRRITVTAEGGAYRGGPRVSDPTLDNA